MNEKKWIREQIKSKLSLLESEKRTSYNQGILQQLQQLDEWKSANTIATPLSFRDEVDTYELVAKAWEQNKTIAIPKTDFSTKEMSFHVITSIKELEYTKFGLLEPRSEEYRVIPSEIDLMIVPGLAFSKENGTRLGYGGGFYDRYLNDYTGPKISLAFPFQVIPTVPSEKHDVKVDKIICPHQVITYK
ncbi:5-formyltetrahydrofolate cyclo-ligase [Bacillus sp. TS-2]|nr:5-formyltetrahydrofolate cyclo-ligase [Bacillus sp. TS-2]